MKIRGMIKKNQKLDTLKGIITMKKAMKIEDKEDTNKMQFKIQYSVLQMEQGKGIVMIQMVKTMKKIIDWILISETP